MNAEQTKDLLQKYLAGNCSEQERQLVDRWYIALEETGNFDIDEQKKKQLGERMENWLQDQISGEKQTPIIPVAGAGRRRVRESWWWVAAAAVILMGGFFLFSKYKEQGSAPAELVRNADEILAPAAIKASITLANGQKIWLDSLGNTDVTAQNGVKLVKLPNGEIAYEVTASHATGSMQYNTLDNPRGSKVATIMLADGSRIWLNTASSLTYPIAFDGDTRKVSITGEAYFEVAHNASQPFIVSYQGIDVQVLGTHFNINAYNKEEGSAVTLLQGSVRIKNNRSTQLLKPGQQATVTHTIEVNDDVNTEEVMAWKNGLFHFHNTSLTAVLDEIGRWYDMDIVFSGEKPLRKFGGEISRSSTLGQVLKVLEESNVHFEVIGKKIVVTQ